MNGLPPSPLRPQVRTALTLEAKEEARRFFDVERVRLLQEIAELKSTKKQTDEALSNMIQADKMKAGDLRVEHQQHQEQISKIKWDCEKDIRRLVRTNTAAEAHLTPSTLLMFDAAQVGQSTLLSQLSATFML